MLAFLSERSIATMSYLDQEKYPRVCFIAFNVGAKGHLVFKTHRNDPKTLALLLDPRVSIQVGDVKFGWFEGRGLVAPIRSDTFSESAQGFYIQFYRAGLRH
jgi:hypothetical protein